MGIPFQKDVKDCPICRKRIDDFNVHILLCSTKKALMQHHDAIKHCVKDLCAAAGLHVDAEASPFLKGRESHLTRKTRGSPDLIIYNLWKRGSALAVDISIANPFSKVGGANPKPLGSSSP